MSKGLEAFLELTKLDLGKPLRNAGNEEIYRKMSLVKKELKAFEFLAKELRVRVGVDTNNRDDVNFACLGVIIDDKFYIVDSAYENNNPEKYKQLLELSEVLKND